MKIILNISKQIHDKQTLAETAFIHAKSIFCLGFAKSGSAEGKDFACAIMASRPTRRAGLSRASGTACLIPEKVDEN
jgi:hypothetical protein